MTDVRLPSAIDPETIPFDLYVKVYPSADTVSTGKVPSAKGFFVSWIETTSPAKSSVAGLETTQVTIDLGEAPSPVTLTTSNEFPPVALEKNDG